MYLSVVFIIIEHSFQENVSLWCKNNENKRFHFELQRFSIKDIISFQVPFREQFNSKDMLFIVNVFQKQRQDEEKKLSP